jgi:kumamolisin
VSVLLRRKGAAELRARVEKLSAGDRSIGFLPRDEFARRHGADPVDGAAVARFANEQGLALVSEDLGRRTMVLSGTVAQFNQAFAVDLRRFQHPGGAYRGRIGPIQLPEELTGVVEAVLGLDNRPQARTQFRIRPPSAGAAPAAFTPPQVAALYDYPTGGGEGQCIGLIELGGGYRPADLSAYFAGLGIDPPAVTAVSVDRGENSPTGDASGPDGEVMLDIEIAGSVASGAAIAVYFAPNTDAGFVDAVSVAAHDQTNRPSILSISWGGPEASWTAQAMTALDEAFQAAAAMGVSICVASGDHGSSDGLVNGSDNVDFPASSPHALACGGTSLRASGPTIAGESVWNDGAAGGVSAVFALPPWQSGLAITRATGKSAPLTKRGVPDVAGDADPDTGYRVRVDGADMVYGGTSAVAPLWAGLLARINASRGSPVGPVSAELYANPRALNDITQGGNGDFSASPGWDACTGLGSPKGAAIEAALSK